MTNDEMHEREPLNIIMRYKAERTTEAEAAAEIRAYVAECIRRSVEPSAPLKERKMRQYMLDAPYMAELGAVLYERMEHMDPSHESRTWEQLTDRERELYVTCAESVVVAVNRQAEPPAEPDLLKMLARLKWGRYRLLDRTRPEMVFVSRKVWEQVFSTLGPLDDPDAKSENRGEKP